MGKAPIGIGHELAISRGALPEAYRRGPAGQVALLAPPGTLPAGSVLHGELLTGNGPTVRISDEGYRRSRLFAGATTSVSPTPTRDPFEPQRAIEAYRGFGADDHRGASIDIFV